MDVDVDTGEVHVRRFYALDDCGTRINPMIIEGQVHGGLTEAFGIAMGQEIAYDADGNVTPASFQDYFIPTAVETPHWETDWTTDAVAASSHRRQGRGREPQCRRRAVFLQCRERRVQVPGLGAYPDAARPLAHLDGRREIGAARRGCGRRIGNHVIGS